VCFVKQVGKGKNETVEGRKREWWSQLKLSARASFSFPIVRFPFLALNHGSPRKSRQARPVQNRISRLRSPDKI
jgi:hypothetical protein